MHFADFGPNRNYGPDPLGLVSILVNVTTNIEIMILYSVKRCRDGYTKLSCIFEYEGGPPGLPQLTKVRITIVCFQFHHAMYIILNWLNCNNSSGTKYLFNYLVAQICSIWNWERRESKWNGTRTNPRAMTMTFVEIQSEWTSHHSVDVRFIYFNYGVLVYE
jgi:hypothetical protein